MLTKTKNFLLILIGALFIDQASKHLAMAFLDINYNMGLFLGFGKDYFSSTIIMFLGTFSIFLLAVYIFFLTNLGPKFNQIKGLLSFLTGGILGNVVDRVLYGKTIDFIPGIKSSFNLADVFISFSIFYLIYLIITNKTNIFFENDIRKQLIVNRKEQFRLASYFAISSFLTSLIAGVFIYTFFRYNNLVHLEKLNDFVLLYIILMLLSTGFFFIFGLALSHKSIGALYAFEKYITDLIHGNNRDFHLRENDDFKHLTTTAKELRKKIYHE